LSVSTGNARIAIPNVMFRPFPVPQELVMRKRLITATAVLLALAALEAVSHSRAEAQFAQVAAEFAEKELVPLLKKAITKTAKDVQIQGGMDLAKAIVDEGVSGKPKVSGGAVFVKTKKGSTYKLTVKKSSGKYLITIAKANPPRSKTAKGKTAKGK
jgi:hypothetical protein